jgi:WhiB family redox-sensing transcriptional regulator
MLMTSRPPGVRRDPHDLTDSELADRVYRLARCAGSPVDPDVWFPVTHDVAKARDQAAQAIAVCACCPVRPDCLELSLRYAFGIGAHGVWGGLVEEERRSIRRRWLAGTSVSEFLQDHTPPVTLSAYGDTSSWLSTMATPGAEAAAARAAAASCSECTCP